MKVTVATMRLAKFRKTATGITVLLLRRQGGSGQNGRRATRATDNHSAPTFGAGWLPMPDTSFVAHRRHNNVCANKRKRRTGTTATGLRNRTIGSRLGRGRQGPVRTRAIGTPPGMRRRIPPRPSHPSRKRLPPVARGIGGGTASTMLGRLDGVRLGDSRQGAWRPTLRYIAKMVRI